jgi:L-alanine-DL-glutamate epimerase-like enolase superfamily enzyme
MDNEVVWEDLRTKVTATSAAAGWSCYMSAIDTALMDIMESAESVYRLPGGRQ